MVVDAGAEERQLARRVDVARRELAEMRGELLLGERRLEVERAAEADAGRDVAEELVDRGDADRPQHLLPVVVGEGEVRVRSLVGQDLLVRLDVEQRVDLGRIREADADRASRRRTGPR